MPFRETGLKFIQKAVGYLPNSHASITSVDMYFLTSWYCVMWHPKLRKTLNSLHGPLPELRTCNSKGEDPTSVQLGFVGCIHSVWYIH